MKILWHIGYKLLLKLAGLFLLILFSIFRILYKAMCLFLNFSLGPVVICCSAFIIYGLWTEGFTREVSEYVAMLLFAVGLACVLPMFLPTLDDAWFRLNYYVFHKPLRVKSRLTCTY